MYRFKLRYYNDVDFGSLLYRGGAGERQVPSPEVERELSVTNTVVQWAVAAGCVGGAIVGFVGGSSFGEWYGRATAHASLAAKSLTPRERVVLEFRTGADEFQRSLPKRLDDLTVVTSVQAIDNRLIYTTQVDMVKGNIDPSSLLSFMKEQDQKSVCKTSEFAQDIRDGGIVEYRYVDTSGVNIGKISIDRCS